MKKFSAGRCEDELQHAIPRRPPPGRNQNREISERLATAFRERIAGQISEVIRWRGGDYVGPHGLPCRRTKPFPFFIYYRVQGDTIHFLGLVHERRHPDFLKRRNPPSES